MPLRRRHAVKKNAVLNEGLYGGTSTSSRACIVSSNRIVGISIQLSIAPCISSLSVLHLLVAGLLSTPFLFDPLHKLVDERRPSAILVPPAKTLVLERLTRKLERLLPNILINTLRIRLPNKLNPLTQPVMRRRTPLERRRRQQHRPEPKRSVLLNRALIALSEPQPKRMGVDRPPQLRAPRQRGAPHRHQLALLVEPVAAQAGPAGRKARARDLAQRRRRHDLRHDERAHVRRRDAQVRQVRYRPVHADRVAAAVVFLLVRVEERRQRALAACGRRGRGRGGHVEVGVCGGVDVPRVVLEVLRID